MREALAMAMMVAVLVAAFVTDLPADEPPTGAGLQIASIGGSVTRQPVRLREMIPGPNPHLEIPSPTFMGGGRVTKWYSQPWRWDDWSDYLGSAQVDIVWWQPLYNEGSLTPEITAQDLLELQYVYSQIVALQPTADIYVSPGPRWIDTCFKITEVEMDKSAAAAALLLTWPGIQPGPVLSPIYRWHTYDGCHQNRHSPHGEELLLFGW